MREGALRVMTDDDIIAALRAYVPLMSDDTLRNHLRVFRQVCYQRQVIVVQATPDDFATISQRKEIGWQDDRP